MSDSIGSGGEAGHAGEASTTGDETTAATESEEAHRFLREYAALVCVMYRPCCMAEGLGYDGPGCTEALYQATQHRLSGQFSPNAAEHCLSVLADRRVRDAERCEAIPSFDEATALEDCRSAFEPVLRSGKEPGDACQSAIQCAATSGQRVECFEGHCLLRSRGTPGDGPCVLSSALAEERVTEFFECEARDHLFCHLEQNACAELVDLGEPCPYLGTCQPGAECVLGICTRLPEPGERCLPTTPGLCAAGSACQLDTSTCGPALREGESCELGRQCASGSCTSGSCAKPEFVVRLSCTGD